MKALVDNYLNMNAAFHYSDVCMYTNTPDEHFITDYHSHYPNIIIASSCSGHGFKFPSLTGKVLADIAMEKKLILIRNRFGLVVSLTTATRRTQSNTEIFDSFPLWFSLPSVSLWFNFPAGASSVYRLFFAFARLNVYQPNNTN